MKVNINSWHYKAATYYRDTNPRSLCGYFWSMVFGVTIVPAFFSAVVLGFIFILSLPFLQLFVYVPLPFVIVGAGLDICILGCIFKEHRPDVRTVKEESVVTQYIKAKKQRICPLIEYER